jgi:ABC-type polysaccharide/polyol phosphate export permease
VEGVNAELRHYLARLARRSRCVSDCMHVLRRAVKLFVYLWNRRQFVVSASRAILPLSFNSLTHFLKHSRRTRPYHFAKIKVKTFTMVINRSSLPLTQLQSASRIWSTYAPNALLLIGAALISFQYQSEILVPITASPSFVHHAPAALLLIVTCSLICQLLLHPLTGRLTFAKARLTALTLAILTASALLVLLIPALPPTQIAVFALFAFLLGGFVTAVLVRTSHGRPPPSRVHGLLQLWDKRELAILWTRNNIRARYSQAILGLTWVILLPVLQALIIAFVFAQIVRVTTGDVPYVSFYLAALVPWAFLNNGIIQGSVSVSNQLGLINQIYFPREILPLVRLNELAVDAFFTFIALFAINLLVGIPPSAAWVALPVLAAITFAGTLGVSLFLSVATVYIRDIPQLIFVVMQLLFYLTPIIYPIDFLPESLRPVVMLNPLTPLIQAFREVLVFNHPVAPVTLFYPAVIAATLLVTGYSFFKAYERKLTDYA